MLEVQAGSSPAREAIASPGGFSLDYRGLYSTVDRLRLKLAHLGVGGHDRVVVVLPNGPEMAVAFLACAAAATCAPLNPAYQEAEFDFYLSDLDAKALITSDSVAPAAVRAAEARGLPVLGLSRDGLFTIEGRGRNGAVHASLPTGGRTALVLHTSGTTARPKQVPLTHANLCVSADNIRATLELTPEDRCMNVMPLFHIHGLAAALLASLAAGASVVCTSGFDGLRFHALLAKIQPTWYTAVPTMHQVIVDRAPREIEAARANKRLRFIRSCSAALAPRLMSDVENLFAVPMVEAYGMTEASHQMAVNPLPPGTRKPASVGPEAGCRIAIMDDAGNLLETGQSGEVVIQGEGVMAGYHGNPEANRTSFTNGWFRTGDRGHLDADGYLYLTGRLKEIINRGGEKISPREVDDVLMSFPGIREAVTFALPHRTLGEEVAAAVVLKEGVSATEKQIRDHASVSLASFKVPRRIVFVSEVPKGPTGKMQRIGLAGRLGIES
ncbi:MAG: AMP-binding protein [Bryobacterales bacterium]|nr:AMP-binding protein [Bryobacterales bacterium]